MICNPCKVLDTTVKSCFEHEYNKRKLNLNLQDKFELFWKFVRHVCPFSDAERRKINFGVNLPNGAVFHPELVDKFDWTQVRASTQSDSGHYNPKN